LQLEQRIACAHEKINEEVYALHLLSAEVVGLWREVKAVGKANSF